MKPMVATHRVTKLVYIMDPKAGLSYSNILLALGRDDARNLAHDILRVLKESK